VAVVSGGARGVDQAAMLAALLAGGNSVGALAERLEQAATARDNRGPLRDGRLALVTPYEPDAHFTVGRSMGRNKLIYALAEFGLVVRFTPGEGGTWAGAVERLSANRNGASPVPVFARRQGNDEAGLRELLGRGAISFPEEALDGRLMETLARAAQAGAAPVQTELFVAPLAEPPPPAPAPVTVESCYSRCLPLLLGCLREKAIGASGLKALAERLEVQLAQLKAWVQRAVKEGTVVETKEGRKKVYRPAGT
jgi:predicted Rossmann fold nucleotide-binding protein DprA/Smf involved in DNA uptake